MTNEDLFKSISTAMKANLNVAVFIVIGFPHETRKDVKENLSFVKKLRKMGIADLIVNYYTALPGTEIFNSLYDAGKIRFDKKYFSHILHGSQLYPAVSHSENFTRFSLLYWKCRIFFSFYGTRPHTRIRTTSGSILRAVSGLSESAHESKLQTAFRVAVRSGLTELVVKLRKPWVSKEQENQIFENWNSLYKKISEQKLSDEVRRKSPVDTSELHLYNVIQPLKVEHNTAREMALN
jgi:hypothetical protein